MRRLLCVKDLPAGLTSITDHFLNDNCLLDIGMYCIERIIIEYATTGIQCFFMSTAPSLLQTPPGIRFYNGLKLILSFCFWLLYQINPCRNYGSSSSDKLAIL